MLGQLGQQLVNSGAGLLDLAVGQQGTGVEGERRQQRFRISHLSGELHGAGGVGQGTGQLATGQPDQSSNESADALHEVRRACLGLGDELVGAIKGSLSVALPVALDNLLGPEPAQVIG